MEYYRKSINEVLKDLKTTQSGITEEEAKKRLEIYGENKLKAKKQLNALKLFLSQFKSVLTLILLVAVIISFAIGDKLEGTIILSILFANGVIGFFQEYKAEKTIEKLKNLTETSCVVIRNGRKKNIQTKNLVPGDIVELTEGTKIPADIRVLNAILLQTQESSLTGESTPVTKTSDAINKESKVAEQKNMLFSGTIITKGKALGVVIETAEKTEIGKIATLISNSKKEQTPLQKQMNTFAKKLGVISLVLTAAVFGLSLLRGGTLFETFKTAISLAVAIVPEGLPAVIVLTLAISIQRMAKRKAIIRKLSSAETLGSVTVICTDKTGTLTCNEMTVTQLFYNNKFVDVTGQGYGFEGTFSEKLDEEGTLLLRVGSLCNDAEIDEKQNFVGDPTEVALLVSAEKANLNKEALQKTIPRIKELPFDSTRKMMSTINQTGNNKTMYVKGAPDKIITQCTKIQIKGKIKTLTQKEKEELIQTNEKMADSALRTLAFAYKPITSDKDIKETDLIFIGIQGMIDPPRPEVKDAIKKCKQAGIKVIMITGDHLKTAVAIGKNIGITGKAITGDQIDKVKGKIEDVEIYARVTPDHKHKIIEALRKEEHIIAMTGDGVNDAPAIEKADIGISMGITGTDVTKEAASMILKDDNFSTIVKAVEEGRIIYKNIKKFIFFLLSSNASEILIILFALIIGLKQPLLAIHLLWINLLTDGLPAVALGTEKKEIDVMKEKPIKHKKILTNLMIARTTFTAIIITAVVLALFILKPGINLMATEIEQYTYAITIAFTSLVILELFNAINARSEEKFFWQNLFSNKYLTRAIVSSLSLHFIILGFFSSTFKITALPIKIILLITAISSIILLTDTIFKVIIRKLKITY